MKKLILMLATVLLSTPPMAQTAPKNEITDSFTDKIKMMNETEQEMLVQFSRHPAQYKLPKNGPRYQEVKAKLEKLKKEEKKVKVTAIIPIMEIKDVTE